MRCLFFAGVEWVDIEHRKMVGVIDSLSWTFGNATFAIIAYFVRDWRWLIISVTSPLILAIITWRYGSKAQDLLFLQKPTTVSLYLEASCFG